MKFFFGLLVIHMAFARSASAAGYSTGFETGFDYAGELAGQGGWVIDNATLDLSFFADVNQSMAGAFGGYYEAIPGPAVIKLSHPVGVPLANASFSVSIVMIGSTAEFPGRDGAAWRLTGPAGENLFTLGFEPAANNAELLNITWSTGGRNPVLTGQAVFINAPYQIQVTLGSGSGSNLPFSVTITGSNAFTFGEILPGMANQTWASIEAHFIVKGAVSGDNFLAFDNLAAVPASLADADGDGYTAAMEEWFGTSDTNAASSPAPVLSLSPTTVSLTFPSISGRDYLVDSSDDLQTWATTTVTATAATTHWLDPAGPAPRRRYFKIRKP